MSELGQAVLAIVGGIITLAIVAVIVGRNSKAPAALAAAGGVLTGVVGAAVNPLATSATNGDPAKAAFTAPQLPPFKF